MRNTNFHHNLHQSLDRLIIHLHKSMERTMLIHYHII